MSTSHGGTATFLAAAAISSMHLRLKFTAANTVNLAGVGATDATAGTAITTQPTVGGQVGVRLINDPGTHIMVAAGAIAAGAVVYGAASGKISTTSSGTALGTAVTAAAADGDLVEVALTK